MKVFLNDRGSTTFVALITMAAVGAGLVSYMNSMKKMDSTIKSLNSQNRSLVAMDKLRTLGNFLVSSNTIICKQSAFTGMTEGYRCKWTGKQLADGSLVTIEKSKIGLSDGVYDEKGFLMFDVDSSKIINADEKNQNNIIELKGKLGFKLYDAKEDTLSLADKLERIPVNNLMADGDRAVVLIKVAIDFRQGNSAKSTKEMVSKLLDDSTDSKEDDSSQTTTQQVTEYFSTRRPIAIPRMMVNQANCKRSCEISVGRNDNPACRGDQNFRYSQEVAVNAKTENLGPGVLYELKVQKDIVLDKDLFPSVPDIAPVMVDAMPGKDYLMPGESVDWTDNMVCLDAKKSVNVYVYRFNGNCYSDSSFTQPVPCADRDDAGNQHFVNAGTVSYNVDASPYSTSFHSDVLSLLNKEFPDGMVQMNWRVPSGYINKTLSLIEPARTVKKIITSGSFPTKMDTKTTIIEIPPH